MNSTPDSTPDSRHSSPPGNNAPLRLLERKVEDWLSRLTDPSHDAEHVGRVLRMAERLGRRYGADLEVLRAAALLHDLGRAMPESDRPHVDLSVEIAEELMEATGFPEEKRDAVRHCILAHSFSRGVPPETLEAQILRDADRLDALGVMGIMRTISYGSTFYDPKDPLARSKARPEGDRYCIEHFYDKLFKLPEGLFSEEARRIARSRVAFMEAFLEQLEKEVTGDE